MAQAIPRRPAAKPPPKAPSGRSRSAAPARAASPAPKRLSASPQRSRSGLMGRYADLNQVLVLPPMAVHWSEGLLEEELSPNSMSLQRLGPLLKAISSQI